MTAKEMALHTISLLPDSATLEEIQERLDFIAAVREGLAEVERGETLSYEEARQELSRWLGR